MTRLNVFSTMLIFHSTPIVRRALAEALELGTRMKSRQIAPKNIDEYIAGFPDDVQAILQKIRMTIRKAAPDAEETISYQIPTYTLNGRYLIYFAAYQRHVSVYPAPRGVEQFKAELAVYKGGKGTIQFPLNKPIPFGLIRRIVKYRVKENMKSENDLPKLAAPAQRALASAGVQRLAQLTKFNEDEIKHWHGIGPNALDQLRRALGENGLSFAKPRRTR